MFWDPMEDTIENSDIAGLQKALDLETEVHIQLEDKIELWGKYMILASGRSSTEFLDVFFQHKNLKGIFLETAPGIGQLNSAFVNACTGGKLENAKYLSEIGGGKIDMCRVERSMFSIIRNGHLHVVKYLIETGRSIKSCEEECLETAASKGDLCLVIFVLNLDLKLDLNQAYENAGDGGHLNVLQYLDSLHPGKDVLDDGRGEALIYASRKNHFEVVKYLCKNFNFGCEISYAAQDAAAAGFDALVKFFIEVGVDVNDEGRMLSRSARSGNIELTKYLFSTGVNVTYKTSAIIDAIMSGSMEIVELFIGKGYSLNVITRPQGLLCDLLIEGHLEMFKYVSKTLGIDCKAVSNIYLETSIYLETRQYTKMSKNIHIMEYILTEILPDLFTKSYHVGRLMKKAVKKDSLDLLKCFIRHYFSHSERHSLLVKAIKHKSVRITKFLIEKVLDQDDLVKACTEIEARQKYYAQNWHIYAIKYLKELITSTNSDH
jgi:hypothetical protein